MVDPNFWKSVGKYLLIVVQRCFSQAKDVARDLLGTICPDRDLLEIVLRAPLAFFLFPRGGPGDCHFYGYDLRIPHEQS